MAIDAPFVVAESPTAALQAELARLRAENQRLHLQLELGRPAGDPQQQQQQQQAGRRGSQPGGDAGAAAAWPPLQFRQAGGDAVEWSPPQRFQQGPAQRAHSPIHRPSLPPAALPPCSLSPSCSVDQLIQPTLSRHLPPPDSLPAIMQPCLPQRGPAHPAGLPAGLLPGPARRGPREGRGPGHPRLRAAHAGAPPPPPPPPTMLAAVLRPCGGKATHNRLASSCRPGPQHHRAPLPRPAPWLPYWQLAPGQRYEPDGLPAVNRLYNGAPPSAGLRFTVHS